MILDIVLGNKRGFEVLDFIKHKSIPIKCVLFSAYSYSPEFHLSISKSGISDKIEKPLSYRNFIVTVCTTISVDRFVCDKHNDDSNLIVEDKAIQSIDSIKRSIRAEIAIVAMDPDEQYVRRRINRLLKHLEVLERAQYEMKYNKESFSARYFAKGIRELFGGVSNTTISEATKYAFKKLIG